MQNHREAILAGTWYPADPAVLARDVDGYIAGAERSAGNPRLEAIIAPHAGYRFSGPVAGSAYAEVAAIARRISRVVLVGPSHRHAFEGIAVPTADAFVSPLGAVPLDASGIRDVLRLPQVSALDEAHAREHSLEIHLPFLQRALDDFTLVPLVVGRARPGAVAEVLANLWGGSETLIVISTDLSHYLDYESCRRLDARTSQAIVSGNIEAIGDDQACGRGGIKGLLTLLAGSGARIDLLDLRNSGDTQGARDRVVGYGSWTVTEPDGGLADRRMTALGHGRLMLGIARAAIRQGLDGGKTPSIAWDRVPPALREDGAAFVTINLRGRLRGCIGSLVAHRPLAAGRRHRAERLEGCLQGSPLQPADAGGVPGLRDRDIPALVAHPLPVPRRGRPHRPAAPRSGRPDPAGRRQARPVPAERVGRHRRSGRLRAALEAEGRMGARLLVRRHQGDPLHDREDFGRQHPHLCRRLGWIAVQAAADRGHQHRRTEGLGDVGVGAQAVGALAVALRTQGPTARSGERRPCADRRAAPGRRRSR
jgi:AmmeMemoRadiSam system protein B